MTVYYAGIGSRKSPQPVIEQMSYLAQYAAEHNWVLRSGGAPGADSAFERGCDRGNGKKEIFLPWRGFNKNESDLCVVKECAMDLAKMIHPAYNKLSHSAKLLIGRNMYQIMGDSMVDPVSCVICWTADGCESYHTYSILTGGTGSAISLASRKNIPIFNLFNEHRLEQAMHYIDINGGNQE